MCPNSVLTSENEFTGAFWGGVPLMKEGDFTQEDSHSGHSYSLFCPVDQLWTEVSGAELCAKKAVFTDAVHGLIGCSV